MNSLSILFALCFITSVLSQRYPQGGYGETIQTIQSHPGYVQQTHSSNGYGSSGYGGQSGYGHGSGAWNQGSTGVHNQGVGSQWNQGESNSWGKEYGHSNRHNVGSQGSFVNSGYGNHNNGHRQNGYGHQSGYGHNQGGYGNQGSFVSGGGGYGRPGYGGPVGGFDGWRSGGENQGHAHEIETTRIKVYNFTRNTNEKSDGNTPVGEASKSNGPETVAPVGPSVVVVETVETNQPEVNEGEVNQPEVNRPVQGGDRSRDVVN